MRFGFLLVVPGLGSGRNNERAARGRFWRQILVDGKETTGVRLLRLGEAAISISPQADEAFQKVGGVI
jgi:hypothetical protein